jgi:Tol biopolymer transport system component
MGAGPTARWSPDGQWIATTGTTEETGSDLEEIWLIHPDGTAPHAITAVAAPGTCCPEWSPDGTQLLGARLTIFNLDGEELGQVATDSVDGAGYVWLGPT